MHSEVLEDLWVISLHAGAYSSPSFNSGNFIMTIVKAPQGPFKLPSFHFHLYCSLSSVTFGCASPWQRTLALVSDSDIIQSISASEWVIMSPTLRCYGAENRLTFLLKISLGTTSVIISQNAPFILQQTWTKNKKERGMLGSSQVDKDCFFSLSVKKDMHTGTEKHNVNTHMQKLCKVRQATLFNISTYYLIKSTTSLNMSTLIFLLNVIWSNACFQVYFT